MKSIVRGMLLRVICGVGISLALTGSQAFAQDPGVDGVEVGTGAAAGSLVVAGYPNTLFIPRGFTSVGALYPTAYDKSMCTEQGNEPSSQTGQNLMAAHTALNAANLPGYGYNADLQAMVQDYNANTVRFQVSQGALAYEYSNGLTAYRNMVRGVIAKARAADMVVVVSMQTEAESCTPYENGTLQKLPDQLTINAWTQLLDSTITNDKGVILEVFNEPSTNVACNTGVNYDWEYWATGCGGNNQGMATVGITLRGMAPINVLLFDGDDVAGGFLPDSNPPNNPFVPANYDMPSNSAYVVHPYYYILGQTDWDNRFGNFQAEGYAVAATEWDESLNCPNDPNQATTDQFIAQYLPSHNIGVLGFAWDAPFLEAGYLVNSYDYDGNTVTYAPFDPDTNKTNNQTGAYCVTGSKLLQTQFKNQ